MAGNGRLREWATPLTIGAFLLSGFTGIVLLLKINLPLARPLHEWLTLVLVIATVLHVIANWRLTLRYASRPLGRGILVLFALLTCASALPFGDDHSEHPGMKVVDAMVLAPLNAVAEIAGHEADEAVTILSSKGISVKSKEQTVSEIARANKTHPMRVLDAIF